MLNIEPATTTIDKVKYTVEPVTIASTFLGREDHGIPTFSLALEGAGWGVSAGGYRLGTGSVALMIRILEVVGAESWEKLPSKGTHALMHDRSVKGLANPLTGEVVLFVPFMHDHPGQN